MSVMEERSARRRRAFTAEFKIEAMKLVTVGGPAWGESFRRHRSMKTYRFFKIWNCRSLRDAACLGV